MPKSKFVDFRAVKASITMEQVLSHYDLLPSFKRRGDNLSGPCPIHKGTNPTQFRVSLSKNVWNCFSECKHGGNALDFIAKMENLSIHAAAQKAIEWFSLDEAAMAANSSDKEDNGSPAAERKTPTAPNPVVKKPAPPEENGTPNKPLKFRLDKLETDHFYLRERGLTSETIAEFGVGFCNKGVMAERIAIPIRNPTGHIVAYAGRVPGEPPEGVPKYKLPPGFRKSLEVFNVDRASKEPAREPLVIVEGFFDCMKLHQNGCKRVVALMGSSMSTAQEELIRKHTLSSSQVLVMLDEDEAGQAGREEIACRLSRFCFVKVHVFDAPGAQPDTLSPSEVAQLFGGRV